MKTNLTTMFTLMAILSFSACSDADLDRNLDANARLTAKSFNEMPETEADASHQWEANEKLAKLLESFGIHQNRFNEGVPKYPDYYGGAYIREDGHLVVLISGDLEKGKQAVVSITGRSNIEFKEAGYSYAKLMAVMDNLNDYVIRRKNPSMVRNINIFSLIDSENAIVVHLREFSDRKVEEFKKNVSSSSVIKFKKSEGEMVLEADLNAGCKISRNASGAGYGSIGFRAKRKSDGKIGIVTAGHVIGVGQTLYYGGTVIGTCSASQISGKIDAAFVPITDPTTYIPANRLCDATTDLLSTTIAFPGEGTTVNKRGSTTGYTSGKIINTNTTWPSPSSGVTLTNITSATYASSGGDSGGIIYTYISSTGTRPTVGTHIGAIGSTRYYAKASNVLSALGLSRY